MPPLEDVLLPLRGLLWLPPPPVNHWVTYGWIVKSWYLYWIRKPFDISRIVILSICCPDLSVVSYVKFDPQYPFQYNWILIFVLNKNNFCFSSLCLYLRIFGHYISFYLGGRGLHKVIWAIWLPGLIILVLFWLFIYLFIYLLVFIREKALHMWLDEIWYGNGLWW